MTARLSPSESAFIIQQDALAGGAGGDTTIGAQDTAGSPGGNLNLTSGIGSVAGNVVLKTGGVAQVTITPAAVALSSLAGSGNGIVAVSNAGALSWSAGVGRSFVPIDGNNLIEWTFDENTLSFPNHGNGAALTLGTVVGTSQLNATGLVSGGLLTGGTGCMTTGDTSVGETGTTSLTLSFWVYPFSSGASGAILVNKSYHAGAWSAPYTSVYIALDGGSNRQVYANVCMAGGAVTRTPSAQGVYQLALDQWNHVGVTYDGANIRLYVNGLKASTTPVASTIDWGTHGSWDVGGSAAAAGGYATAIFDEVRVDNEVQSDAWFRSMWSKGALLGP